MAVRLRVNISKTISDIKEKLKDKEIMREVADAVATTMYLRIFEDGKAADNQQIGTYNSEYLKYRQRKYKKSNDSKVIVVLTGQLETNFQTVETTNGWGIGVINEKDFKKMGYVEDHFNKKIAELTIEERKLAIDAAAAAANRILNE